MKKIIVTLVMFILCFSMVSCGKSAEEKAYDRAVDATNRAVDDYKDALKDYGY